MKNLSVGGLRAPGGFRGPRFQKFKKPRIQNNGPNTHPKFQHSSSIKKCWNIGGKICFRGGLRAPAGFRGPRFKKFKKPHIQNDGPNTHPKFQHSSSIFMAPLPPGGPLKTPLGVSGGPDFKNSKNPAYRTMVLTHTQSFSILAQLQSV